ncbi:MAG: Fic family protein [Phycisphaerae bacterium]
MGTLPPLPPQTNLETRDVLLALADAHRHLGELKGAARTIPNQRILIDTLSLQEAKDSSEVENIVTTHDELYRATSGEQTVGPAAKEVERYVRALHAGFRNVKEQGLIPNRLIKEIHRILEPQKPGFRKVPGTGLRDMTSGKTIYTPPQSHAEIVQYMSDLERFINDESRSHLDPLIKMALIHYQFESIHPFYDGNGRVGRIINVLYLVANGLLDIPVLYLSRFIIQSKSEYYNRLQAVRDEGAWKQWVLYMLQGVSRTSNQTLLLIESIRDLMLDVKHRMREQLPRIYSQDLLNNLFRHPCTKISFVETDLGVSRATAARHLQSLSEAGFVRKQKVGRCNYYLNTPLIELLLHVPPPETEADRTPGQNSAQTS